MLLPLVIAVSAHDYATDLGARDASASAVNLRAADTLLVSSAHWSSAGSTKPRLATKPLGPHKQFKVASFPKSLDADHLRFWVF